MSLSRKIPGLFPNLTKGDRLFAIITYTTPNIFLRYYLPKPYFILEVHVDEVKDMSGSIEYVFDTNFQLDSTQVFADLGQAKSFLVDIFALETGGILTHDKVTVVPSKEYKYMDRKKDRPKIA